MSRPILDELHGWLREQIDEMVEEAQDQADKLRAVASRTEQAQAAADIVLQTIGEDFDAKTQAAAYDMVKGIGDAEVRKDATGLLDAEFKRRKQVSDQKAEEDYSASYDGVLKRTMAGDQAGALAAIRPTLDPAKRESLRQLALKGPVAEDDVETNVALTGMWVKDPKAFANVDLSTYLGKLTPGTIQKMRQWQQETAGQSSQDALSMRATINAGNAYIEKSLQEIGVDLSVTAGETDTRYANQIRSMATSELEKLHAKLGRAPLDSEIQDAIRPLFKKAQEPGMLWGTNAVTMKDVAAEYDGAGYDLLAAQKDLSDHGEPITVETLRAYKKALDTLKARQNQ